jgi:hypothetical protein
MTGVASHQSKTNYNTEEFKTLFDSLLHLVKYEQSLYQNLEIEAQEELPKTMFAAIKEIESSRNNYN